MSTYKNGKGAKPEYTAVHTVPVGEGLSVRDSFLTKKDTTRLTKIKKYLGFFMKLPCKC